MIRISKVNAHYVRLTDVPEDARRGIYEKFAFRPAGYEYMGSYKKGHWDGYIRLFNLRNGFFPAGLLRDLLNYLSSDHQTVLDGTGTSSLIESDYSRTTELNNFLNSLPLTAAGQPIQIRDYQRNSALKLYQDKRGVIISPPGSGKSLIIYLLIRLFMNDNRIRDIPKILLVVPTVSLVEQMYTDFEDYSTNDPGFTDLKNMIARIHGKSKNADVAGRSVVISTWQSIYKNPAIQFENYEMIIGDEAHRFKAKSLTEIMAKATRAKYRIGTTGTIDFSDENHIVIQACFGKFNQVATFDQLIDEDKLSKMKIMVLQLNHLDVPMIDSYHDEIKHIFAHEKRNRLITNLALDLKGNTLILFKHVEKHGKILYEQLVSSNQDPDRKICFIAGETNVEIREQTREITEQSENMVIVASIGVFKEGINIRELHNLILAAPTKSQISLLQSLGRALRKSATRDTVIYDFADNIGHYNYGMQHLDKRLEIYDREKFPYQIYPIEI